MKVSGLEGQYGDKTITLGWLEYLWLVSMVDYATTHPRHYENMDGESVNNGLGNRAKEFLLIMNPENKTTIANKRKGNWLCRFLCGS